MVYNNAKSTINDANIDAEATQTFNTKITQYCGNNKSAADMNALVDAIAASNGAQKKLATAQQHYISITITGDSAKNYHTGASLTATAVKGTSVTYPRFSNGTTYTADYTTDATGYVSVVKITIA